MHNGQDIREVEEQTQVQSIVRGRPSRLWTGLAGLVVAIVGLASCTGERPATLRIAGQHATDHLATIQLEEIVAALNTAEIGLAVRFYPSGQLGTGELVFGDVVNGTIDIGHTYIYSHTDPLLEINSIPYLVEDYDDLIQVFSPGSNFYDAYSKILARQNIKLLGIYCEGFIGISTTTLPENALGIEDKALTIRVWSAAVAKQTANAIGFNTTTVNWGDVFPALQQGIVDGVMGGTPEVNYTTFREAINYYIPYNPFVENTAYYISQNTWDGLTNEQQQIIADLFSEAARKSISRAKAVDDKYLALLAESGVQVLSLTTDERTAIAEHVRRDTWPKLEQQFGPALIERLKADVE